MNPTDVQSHYDAIADAFSALDMGANEDGTIGNSVQQAAYQRLFTMSADEMAAELYGCAESLRPPTFTTEAALELFLSEFRRVGGFHPEDDPHGLVSAETGEPTFTHDEAELIGFAIAHLYNVEIDPCAVARAAFPPHLTIDMTPEPN